MMNFIKNMLMLRLTQDEQEHFCIHNHMDVVLNDVAQLLFYISVQGTLISKYHFNTQHSGKSTPLPDAKEEFNNNLPVGCFRPLCMCTQPLPNLHENLVTFKPFTFSHEVDPFIVVIILFSFC